MMRDYYEEKRKERECQTESSKADVAAPVMERSFADQRRAYIERVKAKKQKTANSGTAGEDEAKSEDSKTVASPEMNVVTSETPSSAANSEECVVKAETPPATTKSGEKDSSELRGEEVKDDTPLEIECAVIKAPGNDGTLVKIVKKVNRDGIKDKGKIIETIELSDSD